MRPRRTLAKAGPTVDDGPAVVRDVVRAVPFPSALTRAALLVAAWFATRCWSRVPFLRASPGARRST